MQTPRIIKKYPNRRLYDTGIGSYITLQDVKQLVIDQINFQIIDAKTQRDLTQTTLLQILADADSDSTPIFTTHMLKHLIRFYHEQFQGMLSQYLQESMQIFIDKKDDLQKNWQNSAAFFDRILLQNLIDELEMTSASSATSVTSS